MICKECNQEFKSLRSLTTHIQFKHNNDQKEYYDSIKAKEIAAILAGYTYIIIVDKNYQPFSDYIMNIQYQHYI